MKINFYYKKEKVLISKKLINLLLSRYNKIYQERIYSNKRQNIYEFTNTSILKEPLFEEVLNKIKNKFEQILCEKDLKFNKLWLVLTEPNSNQKDMLPYIPHIDKQRYLKAMVYLHDVSLEHGPLHLGKLKKNINIDLMRKNLPRNYKEKGLNTVDEHLMDGKINPMTGEAGDVIFFDTNTPHKAGIVNNGFSRKVLRFDFEKSDFNHKPSLFKVIVNKIFKN